MLGVNSFLTLIELFFGVVANSLSLFGDGALMGVDSMCYGVAIYAERQKASAGQAERADRLGALFSVIMLGATTVLVLFDAVDRLVGDADSEEPGAQPEDVVEVNGSMMIGFQLFNLVADLIVVIIAWRCGAASLLGAQSGTEGDQNSDNMNILGAFAHMAADFVRGVAVMSCGILAVTGLVDAARADAYCSLFVCFFVLAATFSMLRMLFRRAIPMAYVEVDELKRQSEQAGAEVPPTTIGSSAPASVSGDASPQATSHHAIAIACDSPTAREKADELSDEEGL